MKINQLNEDNSIDFLRARILSKQGPRRVRTTQGLSSAMSISVTYDNPWVVLTLLGPCFERIRALRKSMELSSFSWFIFMINSPL